MNYTVEELIRKHSDLEIEVIEYSSAINKLTRNLNLHYYDSNKINEDEQIIATCSKAVQFLYTEYKQRRDAFLEFEAKEFAPVVHPKILARTVELESLKESELELMELLDGDATIELDLECNGQELLVHAVRNLEKEQLNIYLNGEILFAFHLSKDSYLKFDSINIDRKYHTLRFNKV